MDTLWGEPTTDDNVQALRDWLEYVSGPEWLWFAKRLSANDTGATKSHQVGPYLPRELALTIAPELAKEELNPDRKLNFDLASHDQHRTIRLVYYNNRFHVPGGTRDEFRLTRFGGKASAMQNPNNTGAIAMLAFRSDGSDVSAWLAETLDEEDVIEAVVGPVEPGFPVLRVIAPSGKPTLVVPVPADCSPDISALPAAWAKAYPKGKEFTAEAVARRPGTTDSPDKRVVDRYDCEYGLFRVVESALEMPKVTAGFTTVDEFLALAQTVANRRKSRAGGSLERHLATIFDEERVTYEPNKVTEGKKKPDFLFPGQSAYRAGDPTRMLGVKTSLKDRWRQVLNEAAKIPEKHLFTLSEGVSVDQFDEMAAARLQLVVPVSNVKKFPASVRPKLLTLSGFISLVR